MFKPRWFSRYKGLVIPDRTVNYLIENLSPRVESLNSLIFLEITTKGGAFKFRGSLRTGSGHAGDFFDPRAVALNVVK